MKIVFFGTSPFSSAYLDALKRGGWNIVGCVDKTANAQEIKGFSPDLGVMVYFGKILSKEILKIPPRGILNIHHSLLPHWRGPSPVQAAILAGDKKTGVSIILTVSQIDAGDIIAQKEIDIEAGETRFSLEKKLIELGIKLLLDTLPSYLVGEVKPVPQDDSQATYTKLIKKEDGLIDWTKDAEYIERMIRAYDPWPSAYTEIRNMKHEIRNLKIKKAEVIENPKNLAAGIFFEIDNFPGVACGHGALKLLIVRPEGKKEIFGKDFLNGYRKLFK